MRLRIPATLLLLGSVVFVAGAFLPISRMYLLRTPEERFALMQEQSAQWHTHLAGMGGGAVIAAGGMALLPVALGAAATAPLMIAAVAVPAGTVLWLRHLHLRVTVPEGFARRTNPHWHFVLYTVLMQVGLLALALALFRLGAHTWLWMVPAGGTGLTVLAFVLFQDVPPFAHYVWLLAVSIGLLRRGGRVDGPDVITRR
jgi:hypothetical protein